MAGTLPTTSEPRSTTTSSPATSRCSTITGARPQAMILEALEPHLAAAAPR